MPLPNAARQDSNQSFMRFAILFMCIMFAMQYLMPAQPVKDDKAAKADAEQVEEQPANDAAKPQAAEDKPAAEVVAEPAPAAAKFALGSIDPDGPYRMLVTLSNEGAAVERVELSSLNFRDQHDRSGYLGQLDLTAPTADGVTVGVVPPGSPAEKAGLKNGDIITAAGLKEIEPIKSATEFTNLLAKLKPRNTVKLEVKRDGTALPEPLEAKLIRRPLEVIRPEIENLLLHSEAPPEDFKPRKSLTLTLKSVGTFGADSAEIKAANEVLANGAWTTAESTAEVMAFRQRLAALELEIIKRYRLTPVAAEKVADKNDPSYHFELEIELRNLASTERPVVYELEGPNGLPIEGFWFATKTGRTPSGSGSWSAVGIRDVIARFDGGPISQVSCSSIAKGEAEAMGQGAALAYIGVDAQYFAAALLPKKDKLSDVWFTTATPKLATAKITARDTLPTYNNVTFSLEREPIKLAAGGTRVDGFTVFAGPKRPELLAKYYASGDENYSLNNFMYYGWFGWVAVAMLWILHTFYAFVQNYGIAIVMLTMLVRGSMYPLSLKQTRNMAKMQELKPEMDRIAEKYKDDMQKRGQAQNELFRKHNYHPMAGCLPALIQLPIFLGLYRALSVDVELRQAPLISDAIRWCSNLAAPDMLFNWSAWTPRWFDNATSMFGLGPYFNVLPIVTLLLFLLQQKLFMPPPTNEQMALQQKMMKYMMIFMGLMFFKVPSGLCIYFIASSLWGIAEKKLFPQPKAVPLPVNDVSTTTDSTPSRASGFLSKLEKMAEHSRTAEKTAKAPRRKKK